MSPAFNYQEVLRRAEQDERNAPVPCQWPDTLTSTPAAHSNDPVQSPSVSADQVEYGILCLELQSLLSNVHGQWRPRVILEHGGSHTEFDLRKWPILGFGAGSGWSRPAATLKADISLMAQPCDAVLHLVFECHVDSNQSPGKDAVMDLGSISLGPFVEPCTRRMESCTFKDGAIKINMTVTFSRAYLDIMTKNGLQKKWLRQPHCDLGGLELVDTRDTGVFYLMVTTCAEDYREGSANVSLKNPWILPVRFVYKSPGRLHLLCPIPSNWHLLGRVHRGRRVTDEEAQLYAAQIVCAVESLHEMGIVGLLSSENVLLDVFGNIRVITPRLFTHDQSYCVGQLAYTAPEVLSGDIPSQSADWWILGGFIYEILTGLPPFYHQDRAERDRKILMEELNMPTYLQGATADILLCLLNKNPTQRLGGAHGVSEIKKHDFFLGIDWQHPNGGCSKVCPFQPHDTRNIFSNSPSRTPDGSTTGPSRTSLPRKIRKSKGYLLEEYDFGPWVNGPNPERIIGRPRRSSDIFNPVLSEAMQQVLFEPRSGRC